MGRKKKLRPEQILEPKAPLEILQSVLAGLQREGIRRGSPAFFVAREVEGGLAQIWVDSGQNAPMWAQSYVNGYFDALAIPDEELSS